MVSLRDENPIDSNDGKETLSEILYDAINGVKDAKHRANEPNELTNITSSNLGAIRDL